MRVPDPSFQLGSLFFICPTLQGTLMTVLILLIIYPEYSPVKRKNRELGNIRK